MRQLHGLLVAASLALAAPAAASDHADTLILQGEASVDIADVFAWTDTSTAPAQVYLAMTLRGRPAPGVQYVFHLDNRAALDAPGDTGAAICVFDVGLDVQCWLRDTAYVVGDASEGLTGFDLAAWTGFVDDPAFADLVGLGTFTDRLDVTRSSTAAAGACPSISPETRAGLLADLAAATMNDFAGAPAYLVLLRAPISVAAPSGDLLGVWASTRGGAL